MIRATQLAARLRVPLHHELETLAKIETLYRDPVWTAPPVDAQGLPVLLVGGLAATPFALMPIAEWLRRIGCEVLVAPTRFGIDCGERLAQRVGHSLRWLTETAGRPALVIAHSRGGQFARATAVRSPELVRGLITLGSPLNRLLGVHPLLRAQCVALGLAGTLGVPGLMRAGCLWGGCCRRMREDIGGAFPVSVPFVSVYSREDGVVDWRASLDPAARNREVHTTHSGLILAPETLRVLGEEIDLLANGAGSVQLTAIPA